MSSLYFRLRKQLDNCADRSKERRAYRRERRRHSIALQKDESTPRRSKKHNHTWQTSHKTRDCRLTSAWATWRRLCVGAQSFEKDCGIPARENRSVSIRSKRWCVFWRLPLSSESPSTFVRSPKPAARRYASSRPPRTRRRANNGRQRLEGHRRSLSQRKFGRE